MKNNNNEPLVYGGMKQLEGCTDQEPGLELSNKNN